MKIIIGLIIFMVFLALLVLPGILEARKRLNAKRAAFLADPICPKCGAKMERGGEFHIYCPSKDCVYYERID